jgi:hypothetical protein
MTVLCCNMMVPPTQVPAGPCVSKAPSLLLYNGRLVAEMLELSVPQMAREDRGRLAAKSDEPKLPVIFCLSD